MTNGFDDAHLISLDSEFFQGEASARVGMVRDCIAWLRNACQTDALRKIAEDLHSALTWADIEDHAEAHAVAQENRYNPCSSITKKGCPCPFPGEWYEQGQWKCHVHAKRTGPRYRAHFRYEEQGGS
jgi:hypothetical protein